VYSALVAGQGLANVDRWLVEPGRQVLPPAELCVTVLIVCVVRFAGLATGLTAGAVASVAIFAFANLSAPVVKYAATALNVRSSVERDRDEAARLDVYGCVKTNFGRPTPSTRDVVSVAASARWRGDSTPSTRRCPRDRVGSMVWRLTKVHR
jgi:MFS superfamily sulfate permease-like transporter